MFLASCTERIDIKTTASPPTIVIYGKLTTDVVYQSISITQSAGYFATTKPKGIEGATVMITTDDASFELFPKAGEPGVYETLDKLACVEGKTYHLSIQVDFDQDGQLETYTASSFLSPAPELEELVIVPSAITLFDDLLEVKLSANLPARDEDNYYSFHLYRNEESMTDSLREMSIYNDQFLNRARIDSLTCFYLPQDDESSKLVVGDSITLQVDAVTEEYATFITTAQAESRGSIPIFSGPPANVKTNIRSSNPNILPVGFFTAFSSRRIWCIYREE